MAFLAEGLIQASLTAVVMYIIALVVEKHIYKHFYPTVVGRIWDIIFFRAAFIIPVLTGTVAAAKKAAEESAPHSAGLNNVAVAADTMIIDLHISPFMLSIIVTIWICGAVVFLGIFFYKYFKLVRLLRSRSTPDKDLYYWRQKYSLPVYKSLKRVQVRKSELLSSPILVGCIRKTLYLPEMDLEDTDIQFILEHETTHLKRRDLLLKRFYIFVNALHWFNPLMYIAVKKAGGAIESACDFEVVRGKNAETRNRYAELLVYMLQEESQHNSSLFVSLSGNSGYVEQRLSNLADNRRQKRGICVLLAGILIMIILQLFTAVDIHAEPYQNSYLLVQDVEDGVGTVQEIEFRDLYYTIAWIEKEEGEVKRIGDQQDITLRPGQEMHIYLNPEGIPRNWERGDTIVIQFNISEKARLWTGLDGHHGRETTDTHPEVMSGANSNVTTTICIKNYSSETIKIY